MDCKTYPLKSRWNDNVYTVFFEKTRYTENNSLCVFMMDISEGFAEPYAKLTVNLSIDGLQPDEAFIDVNNLGEEICSWLEENGIAHDTGVRVPSGYCTYPLFKFDEAFLASLE